MEQEYIELKEAAIKQYVESLEARSAEDLVEVYRVFKSADLNNYIVDTFAAATRKVFEANLDLRIRVANLLIDDQDPELRTEAFYVLESIIFTNAEASFIVVDRLLDDEDTSVAEDVRSQLTETLRDAEAAPLNSILYAAKRLAQVGERLSHNPAS